MDKNGSCERFLHVCRLNPYTLTIDPDGLKLVEKGHRKGVEVSWTALASRDDGHPAYAPPM